MCRNGNKSNCTSNENFYLASTKFLHIFSSCYINTTTITTLLLFKYLANDVPETSNLHYYWGKNKSAPSRHTSGHAGYARFVYRSSLPARGRSRVHIHKRLWFPRRVFFKATENINWVFTSVFFRSRCRSHVKRSLGSQNRP